MFTRVNLVNIGKLTDMIPNREMRIEKGAPSDLKIRKAGNWLG